LIVLIWLVEYFVRSKSFEQQYANVCDKDIWEWKQTYCKRSKTGPLGYSEIEVHDINGAAQIFLLESFGNNYNVLTLARWLRTKQIQVFS
jgi:hypothetical protein